MSTTDDSGPAFPSEWDYIGTNRAIANGMTLRDYFAAKALVGWRDSVGTTYEQDAESAYKMADAMLKARKS